MIAAACYDIGIAALKMSYPGLGMEKTSAMKRNDMPVRMTSEYVFK
jgi:hypothetical protein